MFWCEAAATCTRERADSWMTHGRERTETSEPRARATRLLLEHRNPGVLTRHRLRPGDLGVRRAPGGWQATCTGELADSL